MQTERGGHSVGKKVKQVMKHHINQKGIIAMRLDPYLQGTHGRKEKADKSR